MPEAGIDLHLIDKNDKPNESLAPKGEGKLRKLTCFFMK